MDPTKIVIVIDPGHGGDDPGAIGGGMQEKKINYNVAEKLQEKLKAIGFKAYLTHKWDEGMSLTDRGRYADAKKAQLLVSIHHNSEGTHRAKGFDIIYETDSSTHAASFKMAKLLQQEYLKMGQQEHRVFTKPGVKHPETDWYTVLYACKKCPAIISEYAFLSSVDVEKVDTLTEQWNEAAAICRAICKYFGVTATAPVKEKTPEEE